MDRSVLKKAAFPEAGRKEWLDLIAESLRDKGGYDALVHRSDDGLPIEPLYERASEPQFLPRKNAGSSWTVFQRIDDPDVSRANAQAREDIAQGATGIQLVFEGAPSAFGYGIPASAEALRTVLDKVALRDVALRIDVHPQSRACIDWVVQLIQERKTTPNRLQLSFGFDPAALFAGTGRLRMSIEALEASLPQSLAGFFAMGVPAVLLEADGRVFHNAGATEAQELGIMLASAVSHLRMFEVARQPLVYAAPHIGFVASVDQDQFLSIAKLRALRLLWARMLESCEIEPMPVSIHTETSWRMLTRRDPETNILRNTIASFAAAVGGADSLTVLPHTITHGLPDGFARRLARNTQLILSGESHLHVVSDPASGSGGMEALTAGLCEKAWEEFRRIESEGGILRSLAAGHIQKRVMAARDARQEDLAAGKRSIIGTTLYAADKERPVTVLEADKRPMPSDGAVSCERLAPLRLDEGAGAPS